MVAQFAPMVGYSRAIDDQLTALKNLPGQKALPAYAESLKAPRQSMEKAPSEKSNSSSKGRSFKSFLRGGSQKHNPMYVLEESITSTPRTMSVTSNKSTTTKMFSKVKAVLV